MKDHSKRWTAIRAAIVAIAALAIMAPGLAQAGGQCLPGVTPQPIGIDGVPIQCGPPTTPSPCAGEQGGHGGPGGEQGNNDLCAEPIYLGASCVAVGLYLEVEPVPTLLPTGAVTQLSRSEAMAQGFNGFGQAHADAHQVREDIPGTLGAGAVESKCDVFATARDQLNKYTYSHGRADTVQVALDLMPNYGIPLDVQFDVLCEEGTSTNGAPGPLFDPCVPVLPGNPGTSLYGANRADIANLIVNGMPIVTAAAAPNTWISLGPIGDLYLNEQWPGTPTFPGACVRWDGDALRLVVKNPLTGGTAATLILSWVSTCS